MAINNLAIAVSLAMTANAQSPLLRDWGTKPWPRIHGATLHGRALAADYGFLYEFELCNSTSAGQDLSRLVVDVRSHPDSELAMALQWDGMEGLEAIVSANHVQMVGAEAPAGWETHTTTSASLGYPGLWYVSGYGNSGVIHAGECLSGFVLKSHAPPGIREFGAEAIFEGDPEDYQFHGTHDALFAKANEGVRQFGKTIAPVEAPSQNLVHSLVGRVRAQVIEARSQGWLTSDVQTTSVLSLIQTLDTHDLASLKKAVKALDDYVKAELDTGRLTSEVDALIRLNADYLLRRAEQDPSILEAR